MDTLSTKADFARNIAESHRILALMRAEARLNCLAIDESRKVIYEARGILDRSGDANS